MRDKEHFQEDHVLIPASGHKSFLQATCVSFSQNEEGCYQSSIAHLLGLCVGDQSGCLLVQHPSFIKNYTSYFLESSGYIFTTQQSCGTYLFINLLVARTILPQPGQSVVPQASAKTSDGAKVVSVSDITVKAGIRTSQEAIEMYINSLKYILNIFMYLYVYISIQVDICDSEIEDSDKKPRSGTKDRAWGEKQRWVVGYQGEHQIRSPEPPQTCVASSLLRWSSAHSASF